MNPDHDCFCDGREECEPAFEPTPVSPPGRGLREAVEALAAKFEAKGDYLRKLPARGIGETNDEPCSNCLRVDTALAVSPGAQGKEPSP